MDRIFRIFFFIFKSFFYSLFAGLFGFLITISLINGNFPPTWNDIKSVKRKIEVIADLRKNNLIKAAFEQGSKIETGKAESGYSEPELTDMNEVIQYHKNQAQLSQKLTAGEMTFASNPPPVAAIEKNNPSVGEQALTERVRKLEDLVFHLQKQIQTLTSQVHTRVESAR